MALALTVFVGRSGCGEEELAEIRIETQKAACFRQFASVTP